MCQRAIARVTGLLVRLKRFGLEPGQRRSLARTGVLDISRQCANRLTVSGYFHWCSLGFYGGVKRSQDIPPVV